MTLKSTKHNIKVKILGGLVVTGTFLPTSKFVMADENDIRKPSSFHTCGR
jgi:hypothetical protein